MSKSKRPEIGMVPGPETGEAFMAVLLWAQKGTCDCASCRYLRDMAGGMIDRHIKEVGPVG